MFCNKCKAENQEHNNYCINCGRRISENIIYSKDLEKKPNHEDSINRINNLEKQVRSLRLTLARNRITIKEPNYSKQIPSPKINTSKRNLDLSKSEKINNLIKKNLII